MTRTIKFLPQIELAYYFLYFCGVQGRSHLFLTKAHWDINLKKCLLKVYIKNKIWRKKNCSNLRKNCRFLSLYTLYIVLHTEIKLVYSVVETNCHVIFSNAFSSFDVSLFISRLCHTKYKNFSEIFFYLPV